MDPWPPPGPDQRQTLVTYLATGRGTGQGAFVRALQSALRPGSRVVVAGAGSLALRLARTVLRSARRVYLVEGDTGSRLSRVAAAASPPGGRLLRLPRRVPRLPEPADLIVLDAGGTTPAWALPLWAALAWERWGGPATRVFPPCLSIRLAPTRDPILHGAAAVFWERGIAGVSLGGAAGALRRSPVLTRAAPIDWVSPPLTIQYPLAGRTRLCIRVRFEVARSGVLTGFALEGRPALEGARCASPPGEGVLLPLSDPLTVERGGLAQVGITWRPGRSGGRWEWRWAIQGADGKWNRGRGVHGTGDQEEAESRTVRRRGRGAYG